MPELLKHIDAISRELQRDVLLLTFVRGESVGSEDLQTLAERNLVLEWFDAHKIAWRRCGPFASEKTMGSYAGEVFIDVPFDEADLRYQAVRDFLEKPDGTGRIDGVQFWVVTLKVAMQNAHHDEPGFWEQWANSF